MASPWAYKIDYDAEIKKDETRIRYLSGPAVEVAKAADILRTQGEGLSAPAFLLYVPDALRILGLSKDEARALCCDFFWEEETISKVEEMFGPEQPGDFSAGTKLWNSMSVDGENVWAHWYSITEAERVKALRKAKASLSRHNRNKAFYHG